MVFQYLTTKLSLLPRIFQPTHDALFSTLPFHQRWRLLFLQPLNVLAVLLTAPTWLFTNRYSIIRIPTRSGLKRCLVYQPPPSKSYTPKPLHIDIHGGAFAGGLPEHDARWCAQLSNQTGAVVISCSYRLAPRHTYPAAHDDIDDIVSYLLSHAADFHADPRLLTLGGSSAGGNLALSAAQHVHATQRELMPKAFLGFCPVMDLRLKPEEKPKPPEFPELDPLAFLLPLYDAYAGPVRSRTLADPRLNPILADADVLPEDMLVVVAGIDILQHEQLMFVERVKGEVAGVEGNGRRIEAKVFAKGFHGWLELPKFVREAERAEAFAATVRFLKDVHLKHGFEYSSR